MSTERDIVEELKAWHAEKGYVSGHRTGGLLSLAAAEIERLREEVSDLERRRGGECDTCKGWVCPPLRCVACMLESRITPSANPEPLAGDAIRKQDAKIERLVGELASARAVIAAAKKTLAKYTKQGQNFAMLVYAEDRRDLNDLITTHESKYPTERTGAAVFEGPSTEGVSARSAEAAAPNSLESPKGSTEEDDNAH